MPAPVITVVNGKDPIAAPVLDGLNCLVTLQTAPSGAPSFFVNRTPGALGVAATNSALISGTTYRVQVKPTVVEARELWYITCRDAIGDSAQKAVWVRLGTNDFDVNEAGKRIEKIIIDNTDGIQAAMRSVYASATLKSVTYGGGWRADGSMHIAINPASVSEWYWAAPFYKLDQLQFSIEGFLVHEKATVEVPMISACARAVHMILGQQAYEILTLGSGLVISGNQGDHPVNLNIFDA